MFLLHRFINALQSIPFVLYYNVYKVTILVFLNYIMHTPRVLTSVCCQTLMLFCDLSVYILGEIFIAINSWNNNLAAYGI